MTSSTVNTHLVGITTKDNIVIPKTREHKVRYGGIENANRCIQKHYSLHNVEKTTSHITENACIIISGREKTTIENIGNYEIPLTKVKSKWTHIMYLNYIVNSERGLARLRKNSDIMSCDIHGLIYKPEYLKYFDIVLTDDFSTKTIAPKGTTIIYKRFPYYYEIDGKYRVRPKELEKLDYDIVGAGDYFAVHLMKEYAASGIIDIDSASQRTQTSLRELNK